MDCEDDENLSNGTDEMKAENFLDSLETNFNAADNIKGGATRLGRRTTLRLEKEKSNNLGGPILKQR